jgi:hypothetical protein
MSDLQPLIKNREMLAMVFFEWEGKNVKNIQLHILEQSNPASGVKR